MTDPDFDEDGFGPPALAAIVDVSRETLAMMAAFRTLLSRWSRRIDLIGPRELLRFWRRHALDSAQLLALAPAGARDFLDLGAGAGFPGLILAMQLRDRPGARVRLVESDGRKAAFLRQAIGAFALPAQVIEGRIETVAAAPDFAAAEIVTARALAPLPLLLAYANMALIPENGCGLFLKGQDVDAELTAAANSWSFTADRIPSLADSRGIVLRVEALSRVGSID